MLYLDAIQKNYRTTVETPRVVASDYSFAQIIEGLRQEEFEAIDSPGEIALHVYDDATKGQEKRESRKCYCCGKVGHIKPVCRKKKER